MMSYEMDANIVTTDFLCSGGETADLVNWIFECPVPFLEDQLVDDTTFIYELVDAVRILFFRRQRRTLRLLP